MESFLLHYVWIFISLTINISAYELSRRENRVGSPEKPLSDLGRLSYISFWTELLLDIIKKQGREIHIKNLSQITFMKVLVINFLLFEFRLKTL